MMIVMVIMIIITGLNVSLLQIISQKNKRESSDSARLQDDTYVNNSLETQEVSGLCTKENSQKY